MVLPVSPISGALAGKNAESSAGRAGLRQSGSQPKSAEPLARIDGRIANRIQSRIHGRIDSNYDPVNNSTSAIESASKAEARIARKSGLGLR